MSLFQPLTFLEMVQRAHFETGTSGSMPTTVVNQPDQITRLALWVSNAWVQAQNRHPDWKYLRAVASFLTVNGQAIYDLGDVGITTESTFGMWKLDTARVYTTATGTNDEFPIEPIRYDVWRDRYLLGSLRNSRTRPVEIAAGPYNELCLGPVPNGNYTVTSDWYRSAQPLVNDSDTPTSVSAGLISAGTTVIIPVQWNMICVYQAMMDYGSFESAPEIYNRGEKGYNQLITQMEGSSLPETRTGGALA